MRLIIRPKARRDLANIWSYSAQTWGTEQADIYLSELTASLQKLLDYPQMGSHTEGLPEVYRKLRSGSHRAIYRFDGDELLVVRVIHEREDVPDGVD